MLSRATTSAAGTRSSCARSAVAAVSLGVSMDSSRTLTSTFDGSGLNLLAGTPAGSRCSISIAATPGSRATSLVASRSS